MLQFVHFHMQFCAVLHRTDTLPQPEVSVLCSAIQIATRQIIQSGLMFSTDGAALEQSH